MIPSIRPVWKERLVCGRCGEEFCPVSGAIPGFVEMGKSAAPVEEGDPDADPPSGDLPPENRSRLYVRI